MNKRKLGNLEVSAVGYGCMGLSHAYGTAVEKSKSIEIVQQACVIGYTFFDTAECYIGEYADGTVAYNEEIVGEALKPVRNKVIIATKFGVRHSAGGLLTDSSPDTIRKSVEGSLKRLGTDYIDLYYQHRIDPKIPAEEVAGVMSELIKEGKIRAWGISETDKEYLRKAHAVCPVTAIQNRLSMMARDHEKLFPVLEELGIGFVAFSPMANGILTAKFKPTDTFEESDYRNFMPQYSEEGFEHNQKIIDSISDIANEKNCTPAQLSMAWMMCKKPYIVPIPGSRNINRIKENAEAAKIKLTEKEVTEIDSLLDKLPAAMVFGGSKIER